MQVTVRKGNVKAALRVLKSKLQEDGRLNEVRERQYFDKPSNVKRRARGAAKLREQRRVREDDSNKTR